MRCGPFHGVNPRPNVSLESLVSLEKREIVDATLEAALAIVVFFDIINKSPWWLSREQAGRVSNAVDMFTASYVFLARKLHVMGASRCHLEPSLHLFKHMSVRIRTQLTLGSHRVWNPAAFLAKAGEDFIGKVARSSGRVSARLTSQRTIQRVLVKTCAEWKALP